MTKKFTLLSLLCALFVVQATAQSAKTVLVEEATQASCGPCASQNPAFDALLEDNADKVVVLKYQTSYPGFDPMHNDNPAEMNNRADTYYAVEGVPTGMVNGTFIANDCSAYDGAPACLDQADIDAAYVTSSSFDLTVSGEYTDGTLNITGTLTATEAVTGDLRLRLAIKEKKIYFEDAPGGTNGETEYNHVLKKFINGVEGIDLNDTWAAGDTYTITANYDMSSLNVYRFTELAVVAFVQDDNTKNVLQAAEDLDIPLTVSFDNNVLASDISGLPNGVCGGEQTIAPTFVLQNGGNEALTAVDVVYDVNGGTPATYQWTGNLSTLAKVTVTLPDYTFMAASSNAVNISLENPNGTADEDSSNNATSAAIPLASETSDNVIVVEVLTDQYPAETSWEVRTIDGQLVAASPAFTGQFTSYTESVQLPGDGCYEFIIFDSFGDGICCAYGEGAYTLSDQSGNVLLSGAEFAAEERAPMTVSGSSAVLNNGGISAYNGPEGLFCGELAPTISVANGGTNDITAIEIDVLENGVSIGSASWTGTIAPTEIAEVAIDPIELSSPVSILGFAITTINGTEDVYTDGNTLEVQVSNEIPKTDQNILTLEVFTDDYPAETYWELTDDAGTVLYMGGNSGIFNAEIADDAYPDPNTSYITEITLPEFGCYDFTIYDFYSDGICCGFGQGSYVMFDQNSVIIADGGEFGAQEKTSFSYDMFIDVEDAIFDDSFTLSPNPTSGDLNLSFGLENAANNAQIMIHDMLGQAVKTIQLGALASGPQIQNINISDLAAGIYVVRLNADGGQISKKVVLTK